MAGRKNWEPPPRRGILLPGCLVFIACLHLLVLIYFDDRFRTHETHVIELSLAQGYQQRLRQIPRPSHSPEPALENIPMPPKPVPPPNQPPKRRAIAPEPLPGPPPAPPQAPVAASIAVPAHVPAGPRPVHPSTSADLLRQYFESIRLKINAHKVYPKIARIRRLEGSVEMRFVISRSGRVTVVQVVGGATSALLRRAATEAIRRAAPFPPIPGSLGRDRLSTRITIHFKLGRR